jgi:hypothetical protein
LAVHPKSGTVLGARSGNHRRADAALLGKQLELDSVKTATTMTEHCNVSENLMALAAHRALSPQFVSFDQIQLGDWTGFDGKWRWRHQNTAYPSFRPINSSSNKRLDDLLGKRFLHTAVPLDYVHHSPLT